jgi:hypothetical protein
MLTDRSILIRTVDKKLYINIHTCILLESRILPKKIIHLGIRGKAEVADGNINQ